MIYGSGNHIVDGSSSLLLPDQQSSTPVLLNTSFKSQKVPVVGTGAANNIQIILDKNAETQNGGGTGYPLIQRVSSRQAKERIQQSIIIQRGFLGLQENGISRNI